jgi:hypothetical protein
MTPEIQAWAESTGLQYVESLDVFIGHGMQLESKVVIFAYRLVQEADHKGRADELKHVVAAPGDRVNYQYEDGSRIAVGVRIAYLTDKEQL